MLAPEVITELSQLEPFHAEWDQLAVVSQIPLMSPACVSAWWRHLAPAGAQLRTVLVRDEGGMIVGLAPFYIDPRRPGLRLPGGELGAPLAPLAAPEHRQAVAASLARAIAGPGMSTDVLAVEGLPVAAGWAGALCANWPGRIRPATRQYELAGCPTISLSATSFDDWFAAKSSSFRAEMRRLRRRFTEAGGTMRVSVPDTLSSDVDMFVRLHGDRWENRGGSKLLALGPGLAGLLRDIGNALLVKDDRFLLRVFEIEGEPISVQLFLSAGGHVQYVAAGWDERFAKLKPSLLGVLIAVEEGFERGKTRLDLGPGEQHYKTRFADGSDDVASLILVPAGARMPVSLLRTAPALGRASVKRILKERLSESQLTALRQRLHKLRVL